MFFLLFPDFKMGNIKNKIQFDGIFVEENVGIISNKKIKVPFSTHGGVVALYKVRPVGNIRVII